jgi:hypothetical protein
MKNRKIIQTYEKTLGQQNKQREKTSLLFSNDTKPVIRNMIH